MTFPSFHRDITLERLDRLSSTIIHLGQIIVFQKMLLLCSKCMPCWFNLPLHKPQYWCTAGKIFYAKWSYDGLMLLLHWPLSVRQCPAMIWSKSFCNNEAHSTFSSDHTFRVQSLKFQYCLHSSLLNLWHSPRNMPLKVVQMTLADTNVLLLLQNELADVYLREAWWWQSFYVSGNHTGWGASSSKG